MSGDRYKIRDQNGIYFITCTVVEWIDIFTRSEYRDIVVNSLNHCISAKSLTLYSWVIMSNHIHFIGEVGKESGMSDFLRDFKKFTSKAIALEIQLINESRKKWLLDKFAFEVKRSRRGKYHKIWQEGNHAILLDHSIDIWQKINYIHENPLKARIVDEAIAYVYSSARDYNGRKGLVNVTLVD